MDLRLRELSSLRQPPIRSAAAMGTSTNPLQARTSAVFPTSDAIENA